MRTVLPAILAAATMAFPAAAAPPAGTRPAEQPKPAPADATDGSRTGGSLLAGAKVGGLVPFGGLGPNARAGVELGYVFPWARRRFAFAVDADYAAPKKSGTQGGDPRVPGTSYDWHLTEQQLAVMPVVMYRFTSLERVTPYAGIGPRIYMLRSTVRGSAGGSPIAETTEQSTKVGFGWALGAEWAMGPGGLLGEVLLEYGKLDHTATGTSHTGAVSLALGYRFLL